MLKYIKNKNKYNILATSTNCIECDGSGQNRIATPSSNKCDCLDKFYDTGILKCRSCHYSCFKCESI